MILIDDRIGSKHYADMIPNSILTRLESADICFEGNGVTIGIEVKKVMDAVGCMFSGRLADHQIPLMKSQYDVVYLLIEGVYRPCPKSGVLQYLKMFDKESHDQVQCGKWVDATNGRKRLMYASFEQWLSTLTLNGGMLLKLSPSGASTAALITSLFAWWMRTDHKSFRTMDETTDSAVLSRPTMLRRMIALLPRVGWHRSEVLAKRFNSMAEAVNAPAESWLIEREIGMETAGKIMRALNGV